MALSEIPIARVSRPRDDVLVSVAFVASTEDEQSAIIADVAATLNSGFRFWEVLVAWSGTLDPALADLPQRVANLRLLQVRENTTYYEKRLALAQEAIGDVVVLASLREWPLCDVTTMIERAADEQSVIIGRHSGPNAAGSIIQAFGRLSGLEISPRAMLTIAFPRPLLGIALAHSERLLATRFPPSGGQMRIAFQNADGPWGSRKYRAGEETGPPLLRRLAIVRRLMIAGAPQVLAMTALIALLTTATAILFVVYAVVVELTFKVVQAGWFTTTLALSMTAGFLGIAIFAISMGLVRLIESSEQAAGGIVLDESGPVNLFHSVYDELNVEIERLAPSSQISKG